MNNSSFWLEKHETREGQRHRVQDLFEKLREHAQGGPYFWNSDLMGSVSPYGEAIEYAEAWLAKQPQWVTTVDLDEVRPPSLELDLIPERLAEHLIDNVQFWLDCDDDLCREDISGGPTVPDAVWKLEPDTREKLMTFCEAVLREVDLSEAAWQPTGRTVRVWRDGKVEHLGENHVK